MHEEVAAQFCVSHGRGEIMRGHTYAMVHPFVMDTFPCRREAYLKRTEGETVCCQGHIDVACGLWPVSDDLDVSATIDGERVAYTCVQSVYSKLIVFINFNQNDCVESQPNDGFIHTVVVSVCLFAQNLWLPSFVHTLASNRKTKPNKYCLLRSRWLRIRNGMSIRPVDSFRTYEVHAERQASIVFVVRTVLRVSSPTYSRILFAIHGHEYVFIFVNFSTDRISVVRNRISFSRTVSASHPRMA